MPWEKSFDITETLDAAMKVFWQQGYQRTTMQDLIKSMGINPGSIYGTFGNKRELFIGVLRHYQRELGNWFQQLSAENSHRGAILAIFQSILDDIVENNPDECTGCLLVNAALEVAPYDEEISQLITEGIDGLQTFYRSHIADAQSSGEISLGIDADVLIDSLVALTLGLRVITKLPGNQNNVMNVIKQVETMLG